MVRIYTGLTLYVHWLYVHGFPCSRVPMFTGSHVCVFTWFSAHTCWLFSLYLCPCVYIPPVYLQQPCVIHL